MEKIIRHLRQLPRVLDDDGVYAQVPSKVTVDNAISFLGWIPRVYIKEINPETRITASPHGNITIDWYKQKNFISVEVGETAIGFFAELPDGSTVTKQFSTSSPPVDLNNAVLVCLKLVYPTI